MSHELDEPGINQDTRAYRVKDTIDDEGRLRPRRVAVADAKADSNGDRRGQAIRDTKGVGSPLFGFRPWDRGKPRAQPEALERLVEDEDDVQGYELCASHGEGEADEDGMEDDAEFEDEDGGHLRCVRLGYEAALFPVGIVHVVAGMAKVVLAGSVVVAGGVSTGFVLGLGV